MIFNIQRNPVSLVEQGTVPREIHGGRSYLRKDYFNVYDGAVPPHRRKFSSFNGARPP